MSGETGARRREAASGQPGGREPAPGTLAIVQSFINSHFDLGRNRGADLFSTPHGLRDWLLDRGLIGADAGVVEADRKRALAAREALRTLAAGRVPDPPAIDALTAGGIADPPAIEALNRAALGAPVEIRFGVDGPEYVLMPRAGATAAIGLILAGAARAMIDGTWERLKICPGDHCGWAFYDHSRNRTGRWCSMSVCGGRAKARAHYHRHRNEAERTGVERS